MKNQKPLRLGLGGTASFTNYLFSGSKMPQPKVGMGATILMFTDRHACTIVAVTPKSVTIQRDTATRTDKNGMSESQAWTYAFNPVAKREVYTLRKNGAWCRAGEKLTGTRIVIGVRDEYYDPHF